MIEIILITISILYRFKQLTLENRENKQMLLLYINSSTTIIKEKQHKQLELIESLVKDSNLTKRESDVLQELIKNKTNREIAVTLNITIATVKFHIGNVLQKLDVKNRVEVRDKLENVDL